MKCLLRLLPKLDKKHSDPGCSYDVAIYKIFVRPRKMHSSWNISPANCWKLAKVAAEAFGTDISFEILEAFN